MVAHAISPRGLADELLLEIGFLLPQKHRATMAAVSLTSILSASLFFLHKTYKRSEGSSEYHDTIIYWLNAIQQQLSYPTSALCRYPLCYERF